MRHLAGMMGDIAGKQALFAIRSDVNAHVSRAVAGRRNQGDFVAEPGIAGDEFGLAGLDDRLHRVVEYRHLVGLVAVVAPVLIFGLAEHVTRIGEGRHPFAAGELGVPADVIDMQMGTQHSVDAVGRKARGRHGLEEWIFPVIPDRNLAAFLVVAKAGIDHDPVRGGFHHQGVDRHFETAFVRGEVWNEPGQFLDFFIGGQGEDKSGAAGRLQFDDFRDFDLAHIPVHRAFPSRLRCVFGLLRQRCWFPLARAMDHLARPRVGGARKSRSAPMPELAISAEKVGFLIEKTREFDVKGSVSDPDAGSNGADDNMVDVLEDNGDDPVAREITGFINAMTEDEQIDLVALMRLGRGDGSIEEWDDLRREAADGRNGRTASYLLGEPLVSDYLAEGLDAFGLDWNDERTTPV